MTEPTAEPKKTGLTPEQEKAIYDKVCAVAAKVGMAPKDFLDLALMVAYREAVTRRLMPEVCQQIATLTARKGPSLDDLKPLAELAKEPL